MISLKEVEYQYEKKKAILNNINLEITPGECIAITGKNGAGKSTLGRLIAGIYTPTKGIIEIEGKDTKEKKNFLAIREKVGIIFQNPENQFLFEKVEEEMQFGLQNLKKDRIEERMEESLKKVGMLEYKNASIYELSLGQKQRIAIAEALSTGCKYLVLDEPTTMLDPEGKEMVYETIDNLKQEGYTIIYITNMPEEMILADKLIILQQGEIKEIVSKKEWITNPRIIEQYELRLPTVVRIKKALEEKRMYLSIESATIEELVEKINEYMKQKDSSC